MTHKQLLEAIKAHAVEELICPRCEAQLNNKCTTMSGKTTAVHVPRWVPLWDAYYAGYNAGIDNVASGS